MQFYRGQNLGRVNPGAQPWANYNASISVIVDSVFLNPSGQVCVNTTALRYNLPFRNLKSATPAPQVGDRGLVMFLDGRRESPVYFGTIQHFGPASATVVALVGTTVNVLVGPAQTPLSGVPYVVGAAAPAPGDKGLVQYLDGDSTRPVYLGPLSQ